MTEEKRELSICEQLTRPAEEFENDAQIEAAWASSTIQHMEAYYKLIKSINTSEHVIRLSKNDDLIYKALFETFPDLNCEKLTENDLKSPDAKVKWREFCEKHQDLIEDHNFGTMLRLDSHDGYTEENTIFVIRAQFVAIEIVRNRNNLNTGLPDDE